ncbi:hypothetical protein [Persicitalea jodogahamensis]|uniref:Uncharacterized protein n=1 Tax=Persicitalea jodogahamensis TaxID=402147 RepID=A0A8J3D4Q6_9BACT|nr:hypothetical protein [Persicitalea jodogahamensis]GHB73543.1 hypothetical protein GCM10007390_29600 [Persicitalea jodogahamensis]
MTNTSPSDQEMTDVFGRFSSPLPPLPQPADDKIKISGRKKAALATAAVLLGGGAVFAAVNAGLLDDPLGKNMDEPEDSTPVEPTGVESEVMTPLQHDTSSVVQNGTITPGENIDIATEVNEEMSFGQAFAAAREDVGPGGIFSWHGEVYNTYYAEEWKGLSLAQRQAFLKDVGFRPDGRDVAQGPTGMDEPDIYEFVIDGRTAIGIDEDHDGVADAVVFLDEDTNDLIAYLDMGGDDRLDSVYRYDTASEQVVGMYTIEEPFLVDVHRLEEWSSAAYEPSNSNPYLAVSDEKNFEDDSFNNDDYTTDSGYVNDAEMPEMD